MGGGGEGRVSRGLTHSSFLDSQSLRKPRLPERPLTMPPRPFTTSLAVISDRRMPEEGGAGSAREARRGEVVLRGVVRGVAGPAVPPAPA